MVSGKVQLLVNHHHTSYCNNLFLTGMQLCCAVTIVLCPYCIATSSFGPSKNWMYDIGNLFSNCFGNTKTVLLKHLVRYGPFRIRSHVDWDSWWAKPLQKVILLSGLVYFTVCSLFLYQTKPLPNKTTKTNLQVFWVCPLLAFQPHFMKQVFSHGRCQAYNELGPKSFTVLFKSKGSPFSLSGSIVLDQTTPFRVDCQQAYAEHEMYPCRWGLLCESRKELSLNVS